MKRLLLLATIAFFGSHLAQADPLNTYLFENSGSIDQNIDIVNLIVDTSTGGSYVFNTGYGDFFSTPLPSPLFNQGWWSDSIAQNPNYGPVNTNFLVGDINGHNYNDFFTFDMAQFAIDGTITSATLSIDTSTYECTAGLAGCQGSGLPATYSVGSVSVDALTLNDKSAGLEPAIYNALGDGTLYGQVTISSYSDLADPLNIQLDAAAIADISAVANTTDYFSIGGTLNGTMTAPTPEPASWGLLGILGIGFAIAFWRREARGKSARA